MKFKETNVKDVYVIKSEPFLDHRGKFSRLYCKNELKEIGHTKDIVQISHILTKKKGTLRGLHFQYSPKAEIKIIKCISGSIFDVAVDLRKNSATFSQWHGETLTAENMKMLYVPEGFAHGFQVLEDNVEIMLFMTEFYSPENEGGIIYDDPKINIKWPLEITVISDKDRKLKRLDENFKCIIP